ncbi:MAG: SDR family NAD(P)-dependent oxidoreductase [Verrucomicrobia bacterium]|nr:SDR family NAD(P)-dependent oxidoreductase [Verrucomicrobiota bacterium]
MKQLAVVTGGGSGVGQATVLALVNAGWSVVALGRRRSALEETRSLAGAFADRVTVIECDIAQQESVREVGRRIEAEMGAVEVLVNAAGTNAPQRALEVLSDVDYRAMMDTNLNGAYYCVQAFLPGMRNRGSGTIVNIISDAGKQASPKAGPAYVMSKFGLAGLTQAINAEERTRGVRAIGIFPGDINTPLLNRRPVVPDEAARARMMQPEDIAACVLLAVQLPSRAVIEELIIRPR